MFSIRHANLNDVPTLLVLIQEMADDEQLSLLITGQTLASDGFGSPPKFRALIADFDGEPAGYAFFFDSYSTFQGRALFLEDLFVRPQFSQEQGRPGAIVACRSDCPTRRPLWSYVARAGLERNGDSVLQKDGCHFPGQLENSLLEGRCSTPGCPSWARYLGFTFVRVGADGSGGWFSP